MKVNLHLLTANNKNDNNTPMKCKYRANMNSKQLDIYKHNDTTLTLAEIFRNDQFGEWSFKEIGVRTNQNFELVHIPSRMNSKLAFEIAKKLLHKNKDHNHMNRIINYIGENYNSYKKIYS
jgi:diacylglycerol kinase family enzyme